MRILTFLTGHFAWEAFSKTLEDAPPPGEPTRVEDCVVAFLHIETRDETPEARKRAFKHTLKHLKWLANKRELERIVLHSFTHLGATSADAGFARKFLEELSERLQSTGYQTWITPFGYFCQWDINVHGESLAKVYKEI